MKTRLLVLTTLYPNAVQFRHGIFVEARLRRLLATEEFSATVIAPVPWFPFKGTRFRLYSQYAKVPRSETRNGVEIYHPRYLVVPRIGMVLTPFFLALAMWRQTRLLLRKGLCWDVIDAHYFYPDGVSAAMVASALRLPLTITARGSDINVLPNYRLPRRMIAWAAQRAAAVISVSAALNQLMIQMGHSPDKIHVLRNGVDLAQFTPRSIDDVRARLGLTRTTLCSVGNLVELKGHHLVIRALVDLPGCDLLIVGDGEMRQELQSLADELQLGDRVRFLGAVQQEQLVEIYTASDIVVLASSREGLPNVLLEALACDTPVVATSVGGIPEVVRHPDAGVLMADRSIAEITDSVRVLLDRYPEPGATRAYAMSFSWDETIRALAEVLRSVSATAQRAG